MYRCSNIHHLFLVLYKAGDCSKMRAYAFEWQEYGYRCGAAVIVAGNVQGARSYLNKQFKDRKIYPGEADTVISTSPGRYWTERAKKYDKVRLLYFSRGSKVVKGDRTVIELGKHPDLKRS